MKYFSTFSGIGGFELGIQQAYESNNEHAHISKRSKQEECSQGRKRSVDKHRTLLYDRNGTAPLCVGYSEIDKYAVQVYNKQFNHKSYGDITKIDEKKLPDFDLLVGGIPCQSWSIAGKRGGFNDKRGEMWFETFRIVRYKEPSYLILENVKGLLSHDKGKSIGVILKDLQEMGYYVNMEIHNSKFYGVPQNRERIFLLCRHIKTIIKDGRNLNLNISRQIISEYLFQILLNNLTEVQKLQEQKSKDWVLGWLLLKEIIKNGTIQNSRLLKRTLINLRENCKKCCQAELFPQSEIKDLSLEDDNIRDGILILMEENKSVLKTEDLWENIDILLNNKLEESSNQLSQSTILILIKQIIKRKTYTFANLSQVIGLLIILLRSSQKSLWSEVLLDLIVIKENTKYARINDKKEKIIISETGNAYIKSNLQDFETHFIVGHFGKGSGQQIFPIGEANTETIKQLNNPTHSNDRVYSEKGLSPTLNTMQGGRRQPFIKIPEATKKGYAEAREGQSINLSNPNSKTRRGRVSNVAQTLDTGMQQHTLVKGKIRRLTPIECERLQGFPDNWTKYGIDLPHPKKCRARPLEDISDTQRYKMAGNAVTTCVVKSIMIRLLYNT